MAKTRKRWQITFLGRAHDGPPAYGSVKAGARDYCKELNYQEACAESYTAYAEGRLPEEVETLLASPQVS